MSATSDHALREALAITNAMSEAAGAGDWVLVAELEVTRTGFLRAAAAEPDVDRAQWQALLEANGALIAQVSERRETLLREWVSSRKARRALAEYDRVCGSGERA